MQRDLIMIPGPVCWMGVRSFRFCESRTYDTVLSDVSRCGE